VKTRYIIGSAIIAIFLVWGATAFMKTTIRYVSFREAATSSRTVQVLGMVDFSQVQYDLDGRRLRFVVYDPEAADPATADRLTVVYEGTMPGNFQQANSVVIKGRMGEEGIFVAEQLLVKCPSKYQGEGESEYQDPRRHNEAAGT
jgi:cytochrome c-type biogenesis protein CcmE